MIACVGPMREAIPNFARSGTGLPEKQGKTGRSERIRTSDPLVPNEVRYQTAPHSVSNLRRRYSVPDMCPQASPRFEIERIRQIHAGCANNSLRLSSAPFRREATHLTAPAGASPSGKATDFDSVIRRFESSRPSQTARSLRVVSSVCKRPGDFRRLAADESFGA